MYLSYNLVIYNGHILENFQTTQNIMKKICGKPNLLRLPTVEDKIKFAFRPVARSSKKTP